MAGRGLYRHPPQSPQVQAYPRLIPPTPLTPFFTCGFEDASIGTHWSPTNGTVALDSTIAGRTGVNAGRLDVTNAVLTNIQHALGSHSAYAGTFRFRLSNVSLSDTTSLFRLSGSAYDLRFDLFGDNTIDMVAGGAGGHSLGAISANTWYTVQFWIDGTAHTGGWSLDGVTQGAPPVSVSSSTFSTLVLGHTSAVSVGAYSLYFDDILVTLNTGDYPFAQGYDGPSDTWVLGAYRTADDTLTITTAPVGARSLVRTASDTVTLAYAPTVLADSPSAYYRMGDASGPTVTATVGNNLTATGSPTFGAPGLLTGDANKAMTFVAASTQEVTGSDSGLPTGNNPWTVETWIKTSSATEQGLVIWGVQDGGGHEGGGLGLYLGAIVLNNSTNFNFFGSTHTIDDNVRHHVVLTWDGTTMLAYKDGAQIGSGYAPGALNVTLNGTLWLAFRNSLYLDGTMDEVAIYPSCLTPTRIAQHYTMGSNGVADTQNLVRTASDAVAVHTGRLGAPPTAVLDCGGEAASEPGTPSHWSSTSGTVTKDTTHVRSGTSALKMLAVGDSKVTHTLSAGQRHLVGRFSVWLPSTPAGNATIVQWNDGVATRFLYRDPDTFLYMDFGQSTLPFPLDQWVTIDFHLDTTANPHVWDWKINGVAQTQKTRAAAASDIVSVAFQAENTGLDTWFDDIALSYTAGDYPIPNGEALGTAPESWLTYEQTQTTKNLVRTASDTLTVATSVARTGTFLRTTGTYRPTVLADSPVAYWQLGEASGNPQDSSGNGHNVTVVGGTPTYGQTGPIVGTTAIAFNGTTDYFTAPNDPGFDVGDVFTEEAWIIPGATGASRGVIGMGGAQYLRVLNTGELTLSAENSGIIVRSTVNPTASAWNHVVATKNGATVKLYINGADVTGTVTNQTFAPFAGILHIGQGNSGTEFFNGSIGQVAVYNYALTAAQVRAHYTAGGDALAASDAAVGVVTASGASRTAADAVTTSDAVTRTGTFNRTASDTLTTATSVGRTGTFNRTASDAVTTSDAVTRTQTLNRTASDTLTIATSVARTGSFHPTAADALTTSDAVARTGSFNRTASDTLTIATSATALGPRTASDAVTTSDAVSRTGTFTRTESDTLTVATSVARTGTFTRTASDTVTIATSVARTGTFIRTASDAVTTSDAIVGVKSLNRTASDAVATSDSVARTGTFNRTASDTLTVATSDTAIKGRSVTVSDTLTTADSVARTGSFNRTASDAVTTSDSATESTSRSRTASDAVVTSSAVARTGSFQRTETDAVSTADAVTRTGSFHRTAADSVSTADAIVAVVANYSFTAQAIVKRTVTATLSADAVLLQAPTASFTADAVQLKTALTSFTADAVFGTTRTAGVTIDAVLLSPQTGSFTADALILGGSGSFTADAFINLNISRSFVAAAFILAAPTQFEPIDGLNTADMIAGPLVADLISGPLTADVIVGPLAADRP